ncbi:hypothetical protein [Clostridium sp.]|uniref:hypothetical protein n=1 Tax=Clostridium sp. TaxID=1506 RepID=UPI00284F87F3|nr:hypothetical protein [Clostridium sp.]MDR3597617.1 hypothetical protein [Clostridium sp.]
MNIQQTSRSAIVVHRIMGVLASVVGYFVDFIFGITLLFGKLKNAASIILLLIFLVIGTLLIVYGIKTKKRIQRFKKYVSIMSLENETSLENIANSCSQSLDFVTKDLQIMINQKFFINAYIDKNTNAIILERKYATYTQDTVKKADTVESNKSKAVTCKNCGASNNITIGTVAECEFCGSAINS